MPLLHLRRRWALITLGPLITLGLILVNFAIFLCTHQAMEDQEDPLLSVKMHVLLLAAQHPKLAVPPGAQQFVTDFQRYYPADWAEMQSQNNETIESGDTQIESVDGASVPVRERSG